MIRKDFQQIVYKKRQPVSAGKNGVQMVNLSGVTVIVAADMQEKYLAKGFALAAIVEAEKKAVEKVKVQHPKLPDPLEIERKDLPQFVAQGFSEVTKIVEPAPVVAEKAKK